MFNVNIFFLTTLVASLLYTEVRVDPSIPPVIDARNSIVIGDTLPETAGDTSKVKKNPNDRLGDPTHQPYVSPLFLKNPKNFTTRFEVREDLKGYDIYERVGKVDFRKPSYIPFNRYLEYRQDQTLQNYFRDLSIAASRDETKKGLLPSFDLGPLGDIFGGGPIEIRPTGYATLSFGIESFKTNNPQLSRRQQKNTIFNFDQQIQLGVDGKIGDKMRLNLNFDTGVIFDFENQLKLKHTGDEDQILQSIEAGNVSMQLGNSLIQGRQNLFGIKTQLKFGPIRVTALGSTERSEVQSLNVAGGAGGGAVETPFEIEASRYDLNRHFFLSHFFRSRYEQALVNLPIINSTIRINRVEVWVEKGGNTRNNRNAIGFVDLGENGLPIPGGGAGLLFNNLRITPDPAVRAADNDANDLYSRLKANPAFRKQNEAPQAIVGQLGLINTLDFELAGNLRRLEPNEYILNSQLGFLSLNSTLGPDDVLFVAYNYTVNGQSYQVGEFSDDVPSDGLNSNVLFLKMLKSSVLRPVNEGKPFPMWDLMMKNIYRLDGFGIKQDGFFLDVKYESGTSAGKINFFPEGALKNKLLLQVLNLDRLTNHTAPGADNYFDYIEGRTIVSDRGLVIFPVLEPFGSHLARRLNNPDDSAKYVFQPLYDDTQPGAIQNFPQLDRFVIEGYYRSSSGNEIPIPAFNLSQGSVIVKAGGRTLIEGQDYTVDLIGSKIILTNESILSSGQQVEVSFESASAYNLQNKTLVGTRIETDFSQNFRLGLTLLNLNERPFDLKPTPGNEPISNTLWGLDMTLRHQSDFITRLLDKLPLLETKQTSRIDASAEFAQFIPGQPKSVKLQDGGGSLFIDDFEGLENAIKLESPLPWKLASYPEGGRLDDPEKDPINLGNTLSLPVAKGFTRAKLAWYSIDQSFYFSNSDFARLEIPEDDFTSNFTRQVGPNEIFPQASRPAGQNFQRTFDLRFLPAERGPYNFQANSVKLNRDGTFKDPKENWAGIMREVQGVNNDFQAANVEYIEFWMMDPYADIPGHKGGKMYLNLGLINEDVLPDQSLSRENAIPRGNDPSDLLLIDSTQWGRVSRGNPPTDNFTNDPEDRKAQDIGLDGLDDAAEAAFYNSKYRFLDNLKNAVDPTSPRLAALELDPSSDNFKHFGEGEFNDRTAGILERYLDFNGLEGNSRIQTGGVDFSTQATNIPDNEDINENGSLNFAEQYWEYEVDMAPRSLIPGANYIVDSISGRYTSRITLQEGKVTWYQFRIPIKTGKAVNGINDFRSINYIRMYLTDFEEEVVLRLTEFQFISVPWIRYANSLRGDEQSTTPPEPPFAEFEVGSVSIEENSQKLPFNYVLPPEVQRQNFSGNTLPGFQQDERSLLLKACGLDDGDARAVFRSVRYDLRQYQKLKMWVHAEAVDDGSYPANFSNPGDLTAFIRLGLDNDFNYYEYEIPLSPSQLGLSPRDQLNVWANEFDFALELLSEAKLNRNAAGATLTNRYAFPVGSTGDIIYVKGTPKLSDIRSIMIGIRNPKNPGGDRVCAEVWFDELRLTDFDKEGGWAANANINMQLADFGSINANIRRRTAGFGPLEQKLTSRPLDDQIQYNISANINLDKLLPQKTGLSLPVTATYGEARSSPKFNPQEADIETDKLIERLPKEGQDSVKQRVEDYRRNRGISMNNWRKEKVNPDAKSFPWDVENFDFSYAYNEEYSRNSLIEKELATQHRAQVNYRYTFPVFNWKPFKESKTPLKLINISPLPTSIDIRLSGDRYFEERLVRASSQFGGNTSPFYTKNFTITRQYNLTWNLTQNLLLSFSANNLGRVDEVRGYYRDATQRERDSVGTLRENLLHIGRDPEQGHYRLINMGRNVNYDHNLNLTYRLPFSEFKALDWMTGNVNYSATFRWDQAPEINRNFGGTATNNQVIQATGRLDMRRLYSKIKPLNDALEGKSNNARRPEIRPGARNEATPAAGDKAKAGDKKKPEKEATPAEIFFANLGKTLAKVVFSVQNADITYNKTAGTILPGYLPQTDNFGLDLLYNDTLGFSNTGTIPPTFGFIMGSQQDVRGIAAQNNWITRDTILANLFMQNINEQISARASLEFFKILRVNLTANRDEMNDFSEFFRWVPSRLQYGSFDPYLAGGFNMSYIFVGSAFEKNTEVSKYFERFSNNRSVLSRRYAENNPNTGTLARPEVGTYKNGYTGTSQDVLISAFLSAYGIVGPDKINLNLFPKIPLPNWSVDFTGLTQIPIVKENFSAFTVRHAYRGTYSMANFNNNLNAEFDQNGFVNNTAVLDETEQIENFFSPLNITAIQISEQFAPFLGINFTMKNGMTGSVDYKLNRQLNFNVGSLQMAEQRNKDLAVSWGYRKDKIALQLNLFGKEINLKNSAFFRLQITMRDIRERNRILSPDESSPTLEADYTRGTLSWIVSPTIDYVVNNRVNCMLFFEQNINRPWTGVSPRTSHMRVGFQLRFNLAN